MIENPVQSSCEVEKKKRKKEKGKKKKEGTFVRNVILINSWAKRFSILVSSPQFCLSHLQYFLFPSFSLPLSLILTPNFQSSPLGGAEKGEKEIKKEIPILS